MQRFAALHLTSMLRGVSEIHRHHMQPRRHELALALQLAPKATKATILLANMQFQDVSEAKSLAVSNIILSIVKLGSKGGAALAPVRQVIKSPN